MVLKILYFVLESEVERKITGEAIVEPQAVFPPRDPEITEFVFSNTLLKVAADDATVNNSRQGTVQTASKHLLDRSNRNRATLETVMPVHVKIAKIHDPMLSHRIGVLNH